MLKLVYLCVAIASIRAASVPIQKLFNNVRIINGSDAVVGQFPYHVAVATLNENDTSASALLCGGSIISESWIVTSAYCVKNATLIGIKAGSVNITSNEDGVIVDGESYIIHAGFDNSTLQNDIALVNFPSAPFVFGDNITAITLPESSDVLDAGVEATVIGFGQTSDGSSTYMLQFATVKTISNDDCKAVYGEDVIQDNVVCTNGDSGQTPCFGDSGAPLVTDAETNPLLVAQFSFVSQKGCEGYPAGYVRIASYRDWIKENTGL